MCSTRPKNKCSSSTNKNHLIYRRKKASQNWVKKRKTNHQLEVKNLGRLTFLISMQETSTSLALLKYTIDCITSLYKRDLIFVQFCFVKVQQSTSCHIVTSSVVTIGFWKPLIKTEAMEFTFSNLFLNLSALYFPTLRQIQIALWMLVSH